MPAGNVGILEIREIVPIDSARPNIRSDKDSILGFGRFGVDKLTMTTLTSGALAQKAFVHEIRFNRDVQGTILKPSGLCAFDRT